MPPDTPSDPPICPVAARVGALLRSLAGDGTRPEVALAEAVALLRVLRPAMPLPALREEAEVIARGAGWLAAATAGSAQAGDRLAP